MDLLLAVLPLLVATALLGGTRLPSWLAGLAALISALPALLLSLPSDQTAMPVLVEETLQGSWLAWQAISVMLAGLFFHAATRLATVRQRVELDARSLFTLVIFIGPFVESAVGFGVGIVVVVGRLLTAGVPPLTAALLSLLSQTLVPWGAFAVGTLIGAEVANLPFRELAWASALLSVPLLLAWLPFYYRLAGSLPDADSHRRIRVTEIGWVLVAGGALVLANRFSDPKIAVILSLGAVILARRLIHADDGTGEQRQDLTRAAPYVALCALLLVTRLIEPIGIALGNMATLQPFTEGPTFSPFLHPSFWLLAVGTGALIARRRALMPVLKETFSTGWQPVLVTLLFVILARFMITSQSAEHIALSLTALLGAQAVLTTPALAAAAGFLTGSNTASNALMMPVQSQLTASVALAPALVAGLQNVAGSAMTGLSPARVVLACTLAGGIDVRAVYQRASLFVLPPLLVLTAVAFCATLLA